MAVQGSPRVQSLLVIDASQEYCLQVEKAFHLVQAGTAVFPISDGQHAIEHLALCGSARPMPDLVLLDRVIREAPDGYAVLRAARSLEHLSTLPILMISGSDEREHVAAAQEAGASGYLLKPSIKDDYPRLAREVLAWFHREKNWAQVGPAPGQSALALASGRVGSAPAMAMQQTAAPLVHSFLEEPAAHQQARGFFDLVKQTVLEAIDPFLLSFNRSCRRHHITPSQAMQVGGSHRLCANRREVVVELINEGWPVESLQEVITLSRTEFKRLHAEARAKVGPKLDQGSR